MNRDVNNCYSIRKLENIITSQESINNIYHEFTCTIRSEMKDRLNLKEIYCGQVLEVTIEDGLKSLVGY